MISHPVLGICECKHYSKFHNTPGLKCELCGCQGYKEVGIVSDLE